MAEDRTLTSFCDNPNKSTIIKWDVEIICNICGANLSGMKLTPEELYEKHVKNGHGGA